MDATILSEMLHRRAMDLGATFFGVANLAPATELVLEMGGPLVAGYDRAISVGVAMPQPIVDQLPHHDSVPVASTYRRHGYEVLNSRLDQITSRLASDLQVEGHPALPIPASQTLDSERHLGLFSHKLAAHLAGLGWIGKSCLLVTPEVGPRVRWASVLTDAPLPAGEPLARSCGDCRQCVEACPASAFTGEPFRADERREARFDVSRCYAYQRSRTRALGVMLCGMCVYSCPFGRATSDSEKENLHA